MKSKVIIYKPSDKIPNYVFKQLERLNLGYEGTMHDTLTDRVNRSATCFVIKYGAIVRAWAITEPSTYEWYTEEDRVECSFYTRKIHRKKGYCLELMRAIAKQYPKLRLHFFDDARWIAQKLPSKIYKRTNAILW